MSRLTDLIAQAKAKDPQLGAGPGAGVQGALFPSRLGLNFERHRPEAVELPQRPVTKGDKVRVLPPRGSTARGVTTLGSQENRDGRRGTGRSCGAARRRRTGEQGRGSR